MFFNVYLRIGEKMKIFISDKLREHAIGRRTSGRGFRRQLQEGAMIVVVSCHGGYVTPYQVLSTPALRGKDDVQQVRLRNVADPSRTYARWLTDPDNGYQGLPNMGIMPHKLGTQGSRWNDSDFTYTLNKFQELCWEIIDPESLESWERDRLAVILAA